MEPLSNALSQGKATKAETCAEHGPFTSINLFRSVWSRCPECERQRSEQERERLAQSKLLMERERLQERIGRSAIPKRFLGRGFDNFKAATDDQSKALSICRKFADEFADKWQSGQGLVLSGKPGTGKSHLAAAIMQHVIENHSTLYVTCMDVIRMVRETWRKDSTESEGDVLKRLGKLHLLVIDEVGVQYGTDSEQTILFDVLDMRYRDQLPTILLTNQDIAGAKQFLGERTWDRIRETSRWVSFEWESYRPQARKEST
jgi:DNA replication protein DnaC